MSCEACENNFAKHKYFILKFAFVGGDLDKRMCVLMGSMDSLDV